MTIESLMEVYETSDKMRSMLINLICICSWGSRQTKVNSCEWGNTKLEALPQSSETRHIASSISRLIYSPIIKLRLVRRSRSARIWTCHPNSTSWKIRNEILATSCIACLCPCRLRDYWNAFSMWCRLWQYQTSICLLRRQRLIVERRQLWRRRLGSWRGHI